MFADEAPSLTSLKTSPEDTYQTSKTPFKAKLIDFGAKTKPIDAVEKKSLISPKKKVVNAEKTVNIDKAPKVAQQSQPKSSEKPAVKTPSMSKTPITDQNSFVKSK